MLFPDIDYLTDRKDFIAKEESPLGRERMSKSLQDDQESDKNLLETDVFKNFLQKNSDPSRQKALLVISGSHIEGENNSQSYPNYLKEMSKSKPDCDFLVLNIDPNFTTNLSPEGIEIEKNVDLKLLKGYLNPAKNPQFYSEIGNNLQHFDKVIFCSHTCEVGALDFHPLHRHCEKQGIDCITIGAYFNESPCCIISKPNLIEDDFVPLILFQKINWFIDSDNLSELQPPQDQDKIKIISLIDFFSTNTPPNLGLETHPGIKDPALIKSVSEFVKSEKTSSRPQDQTLLRALSSLNLSEEVSANKGNGAEK
jgi:hypothetical protein